MRACVVIVSVLMGCASAPKPPAREIEPAAAATPAAPAATLEQPARPEQVATGEDMRATGDPCEGGEAVPNAIVDASGAAASGGGGAPATHEGLGGIGHGAGGMRAPDRSEPRVAPGTPKANNDGLPPEVIRRFVRRWLPRLRNCYEEVLTKEPKLSGLLVVDFTIDANGAVTAAAATGIRSDDLRRCFAKAVQAIAFPKPQNGATIDVRFPFNLSPNY